MEKFSIFTLLDTLSALTATQNAEAKGNSQGDAPPSPDAHGAASAQKTDMREARTAPEADGAKQNGTPPNGTASRDAFAAFLARHDAVSKRAKKQ